MFEALVTYFLAQPIHKSDATESAESRLARIHVVASAIVDASGRDKGLAAYLAVQAVSESALRSDVMRCECPAHECDKGKARGPWQIHKAPEHPEVWQSICGVDVDAQTIAARWVARYYRASALECSFASLGGSRVSCGVKWARERAAKARRLERKL